MVRDASTGKPVANATLQASNVGWGMRGGQLVWDKATVSAASSGPDGVFRFDVDGGSNLRVQAPGYPEVRTSFCPRDTLVLVGGPYPQLVADRRLIFADTLGADDADRVHPPALARELGLTASGPAFGAGGSRLRIEATGGIRLVPGTGSIPSAPPLPYPRFVELDFNRDCGWLFVSDGASAVAVVEARSPSGRQDPGQPWIWSMLYAPLPREATPGG